MKKIEIEVPGIDQVGEAATKLLDFVFNAPGTIAERKVFAVYGPMGAGKTTLIKAMCKQLGSRDNFSSPSYSIVNEYLLENSEQKIYHIDLYRLKSFEEAIALGIDEYITGESYCFIEWPEIITSLLHPETVNVKIAAEENMRKISIFIR